AIRCEYWPPRSRTRTGRSSRAGRSKTSGLEASSAEPTTPGRNSGRPRRPWASSAPIVRRLLGDRDVVRVRLAQPCRRDPDEAGALHLVDRRGAAVAHRLSQPADELVHDVLERALVADAPFDSLGDQLLDVLDVALEVAVLREAARLHRAERAHPAVLLEPLALHEHHVTRRLVGAGEHAAEHDRVGSGAD